MKSPTLACGRLLGVHGDLEVTTEQGGPMTAASASSGVWLLAAAAPLEEGGGARSIKRSRNFHTMI